MSLTFKQFEDYNIKRDKESFKNLNKWTDIDWSNALAGEVGELCNLTKKAKRDGNISDELLAKEAADIITYGFLFLLNKNISVESAIINKFNEVSRRVGYKTIINLNERK